MFQQFKYWYRKYIPNKIRIFIVNSIPFWIKVRFFSLSTKNFDLSVQGHGEAQEILKICNLLDIDKGFYVDIGAADGFNSSSTYPFAKNDNFQGLSIEFDQAKFKKMSYIYKNFINANVLKTKVTPNNISEILTENNIPIEFDILNIDIDSYDLFVLKELLNSYSPKIISMEINEKIPIPLYFTVEYDENHFWKGDHFFGCSLQAAYTEIKEYNYRLHKLIYNNAIFISNETNLDFIEPAVIDAYNDGYKFKEDRLLKFHYNSDVDKALSMSDNEAYEFFKKLFENYEGSFQLKII